MMEDQQRTTATILDEYCRYFADFSKVLGIYVKNFYPQLNFDLEHLLDASFNVWHRLSDKEKLSLANFLEEINQEQNHSQASALVASSPDIKAFSGLFNAELLTTKLKYPQSSKAGQPISTNSNRLIPMNASSYMPSSRSLATVSKNDPVVVKKAAPITPFHIYLKDERKKFIQKHAKMSMRDVNKRLSERWQKMSNRIKQNYEYRAYLAKKRLNKKQTTALVNEPVAVKTVPKIKRMNTKKNNRVKSISSHLSTGSKAKLHAGDGPSDKKLLSNVASNNNNRARRNL